MISFLEEIVSLFTSFANMIIDLITSLVSAIGFLSKALSYLSAILYIVPGGLLLFGVAYLAIFIINRLSWGSNSGG